MKVTIPGRLTSLNQYVAAERGSKWKAATIKADDTGRVAKAALSSGVGGVLVYPVDVTLNHHRTDRRTDPDNVAFCIKFILDGLVAAGVLRNDTPKEIASIKHNFFYGDADVDENFIEVVIDEAKPCQVAHYWPDAICDRPSDHVTGDGVYVCADHLREWADLGKPLPVASWRNSDD